MCQRPSPRLRQRRGCTLFRLIVVCAGAGASAICWAQGAPPAAPGSPAPPTSTTRPNAPPTTKPTKEVVKLPIEQLMDLHVTTAARVPDKPAPLRGLDAVMQTPSAIYVITQIAANGPHLLDPADDPDAATRARPVLAKPLQRGELGRALAGRRGCPLTA